MGFYWWRRRVTSTLFFQFWLFCHKWGRRSLFGIFLRIRHVFLPHSQIQNLLKVSECSICLLENTVKSFSCGELYVNYDETVRGCKVFIIATIRPHRIHDDFLKSFHVWCKARQSFAKSVHVIIPHFDILVRDKIHSARESISMRLCADLLWNSGAEHIVTPSSCRSEYGVLFCPRGQPQSRRMFVEYFREKTEGCGGRFPDADRHEKCQTICWSTWRELILHKSTPNIMNRS